jgi:hypothetical protein
MNPWRELRRLGATATPQPLAARQSAWLRKCLTRNAHCAYGRAHGFAEIESAADYQARVPIINFDAIAGRIEEMAHGAADILFAGHPLAFERTSGSTGGGKLIPYSTDSLADFRRAVLPWLSATSTAYGLDSGCAYWAISPATRPPETTPSGIPIGLPDGAYLGDEALPAFAALSAVPPDVGAVVDVDAWRLLTLYWLVRRHDLTLISVWSPTFFLALLDALEQQTTALAALLQHGGRLAHCDLPSDVAASARLRAYLRERDSNQLWPDLKLISAWGDAAAAPWLAALHARLPRAACQPKGLLATEGVVSVPGFTGLPVLAANSGFFEFLDTSGRAWLAHELLEGSCYEVVMTTAGGLYRYRTGDEVRCEGHENDLPQLLFLGRRGLTSDLVGEKLNDSFVAECLTGILGFHMLAPDPATPGYVLILETDHGDENFSARVEQALRTNPHYAYARRMGQLAPLRVIEVDAPLARYTRRALAEGTRLGDVKPPNLRPEPGWPEFFLKDRP